MALFGKKDICPICGEPVKGLLNVKIKDKIPLCQTCGSKIYMDNTMIPFQSVKDIQEHIAYREQNQETFNSFIVSREQKAGNLYLRIDDNKKLWYLGPKKPTNPPLFSFNEIVDYEFSEDGDVITKGGVGRAVAGGLLFGGVGAIVGGSTGEKTSKTVIKSMQLRISLDNKYVHQILIEFVPGGTNCKSGSLVYKAYQQEVQHTISILDGMCHQAEQNITPEPSAPISSESNADEILKYKQLLDIGAITEEEFQTKKKQLLGL